jgi:hypothetical protein
MDERSLACDVSFCAAAAARASCHNQAVLHFWTAITVIGALIVQNLMLDTMII